MVKYGGENMNELLKVIGSRYSCRSYTGEPVEKEKVEALALAAVQSPSAVNRQAWKIIVIQDKSLIDEMNDCGMEMLRNQEDKSTYERMMGRGGKLFYNAPLMIVVAIKEGTQLDCGIVVENMALAATSLGLGNCICGMARMPLSKKEYADRIIPEGYVFGTSILVGYATSEGTPHVPDMDKITYIG